MNTPLLMPVGVSGVGKTSIGRLFVDILGADFLEADDIAENTLGAPITELVVRNVPGLTEARRSVALRVSTSSGVVVTLGASQIEDEQTLCTLHDVRVQGTRVVELSTEISKLARCQDLNVPRSLALGASRAQLAMMMKTLRIRHLDAADLSVQTSSRGSRQVVESIVRRRRPTSDSQPSRQ